MTELPSLKRSASSCAWSKRRGRTVAGSAVGGGAERDDGRGRLGTPESSLPVVLVRRPASKSRDGKLGRAGTVRTAPESGSAGHDRELERL